jgi:hypothetical protein
MQVNHIKTLEEIIKQNEACIETFKVSKLMQLIGSDLMTKAENRYKLLDCIQTFSNYFQRTLMLRTAFTDTTHFANLAQEHLDEEYGHNISLLQERANKPPKWDPILESGSAWFCWKMLTLDNTEKTLLIHLVLEGSANIFFTAANVVMQRYKTTNYFNVHAENDERHEALGFELLEGLTPKIYQNLALVQKQGWEVLIMTCDRIAELAQ